MKPVSRALETVLGFERLVDEDGSPAFPKSWMEKTLMALILDKKRDA